MPAPTLAVEPLDLDLVDPHPKNPRRDLGDLTELTASIKTDGVRSPIHVGISADGQRYVVLAGHRRRQASLDAGRTTIPAIIREDVKTDAAALVEMAVENLLRADLTPIEEATLFEQLQIAGLKPVTIAKRTGRKRATVDARLALLALPETARDAIHGAQLSLDDAAALVEFADDEAQTAKLLQYIGSRDFQWQVQRAREIKDRDTRNAARRQAVEASGIPVVDTATLIKGSAGSWWGSYRLDSVLEDDQVAGITESTGYEDAIELRRAAHEACPHHAAVITGDGEAFYVCTDPAAHRPEDASRLGSPAASSMSTSVEDDEAEAAAREAARVADEREQVDCDTAAAIRKAFIVDTVVGRRGILSPASCTAIALAAAERLVGEDDLMGGEQAENVAAYFEVTVPEGPGDKASWQAYRDHEAQCEALLREDMARRGGHASLLGLLGAFHESRLAQRHAWRPDSVRIQPGTIDRGWLTLLWELGLEPSAWEVERLEAAAKWAREQQLADDDPGDED